MHWDYHSNGGAASWGELRNEGSGKLAFPECNGHAQSPINIAGAEPQSDGLTIDYRPSDLVVLNNGRTLQVIYAAGSSLVAGGKTYRLQQFHFHSPSEHEISGRQTPLEAHFVHQSSGGGLAVIGVMMTAGSHNPAFQRVLDNFPAAEGEVTGKGAINAADLLPPALSFWAYDGSFTTPPCTEGVRWYVLSESVEVSLQQIETFRSLPFLNHDGEFVGNARPVQPLNGRQVHGAEGGRDGTGPTDTGNEGLVRQ